MTNVDCRLLVPGDESRIESFLSDYLSSSIFLVANMRESGLVDTGERASGTYVGAFKADKLCGCLALFWNGNIVLQAPEGPESLLAYLVDRPPRGIRGLIGPGGQVASALSFLRIPSDLKQIDNEEVLYELELSKLVCPQELDSGCWSGRRIDPKDVAHLTQWSYEYSIEALGAAPSPNLIETSRQDVLRRLELRRGWVLESEGQLVATSAFNAAIESVVQVGGVYTPPPLRGRGFGRAVVAASLREAFLEGAQKAVLFARNSNTPAIRAYQSLGFQSIGDYRLCLLKDAWWPSVAGS